MKNRKNNDFDLEMYKTLSFFLENPQNKDNTYYLFHTLFPKIYGGSISQIDNVHKIRKHLIFYKQKINKLELKEGKTGLYNNQQEDNLKKDAIDCVEDGFCFCHKRDYEKNASYKYHYDCKYSLFFNLGKEFNGIRGLNDIRKISNKFVCFQCGIITSKQKKNFLNYMFKWPHCVYCKEAMECVAVTFEPPAKKDKKKWSEKEKIWYKECRMNYNEFKEYFNIKS